MIEVSLIVPCYNEEATIGQLLLAIECQTYPLADLEVIIADGLSTDHTREVISEYQSSHPNLAIRVIDNTKRIIPAGLNRAIEAARGKYLIRMDAHSIPEQDYIKDCVHDLEAGLGDNVGGIWKIQPGANTWIAQAIAIAVAHPLGVGDALYRIGGAAQEVDTVPFGAFHRGLIDRIGKFDETLLTNEDYEFNVRIRQSGGKVWMNPAIRSIYFARSTLKELSRQFWRYGYWKARMLLRYPKTLRWRQLLPPLFVLALLSMGLLSFGWYLARLSLAIIVILYTLVICATGIQMSISRKIPSLMIGFPLAIATIHLAWGSALLWGLLVKPRDNEPSR
ncbi:MAG TPA: glycosyltransferase family 2 protein [Anaerolineales bacterium]